MLMLPLLCNKTNPTHTFFLTIFTFSSLNRSFCLPYCFPLLSHDMSSCQHRSCSCDTNSITLYFYSHSTTHSYLIFPLHVILSTSLFITLYFYSHSTTYSYLTIPTPRLTLYFLIHYILTMTHSLLLTSVDALLSSLHLCDSLHLPIMYWSSVWLVSTNICLYKLAKWDISWQSEDLYILTLS